MDEIDRISFLFSVLLENGEKHKNLACVLGQLWVKKVRPYWIIAVFHNKQVWAFRAETVDKEETQDYGKETYYSGKKYMIDVDFITNLGSRGPRIYEEKKLFQEGGEKVARLSSLAN